MWIEIRGRFERRETEMLILVDSREQKPYWSGSACARTALCVGDYTTATLLNCFHIERKSLQDLYGTLVQDHPRFRREVIRAQDAKITLVVFVEGTRDAYINKRFPRGDQRKARPEMLDKMIDTIQERYDLEIVWTSGRADCLRKVFTRLKKEEARRGRPRRIK